MAAGKGSGFALVDALNAEWEVLGEDSRGTVARWSVAYEALAGLASLDDVLARIRLDPDGVLAALLIEARRGCRIAPRTVLQAMLGKLVRMSRCDPMAGVDDYVAVLWCLICAYPLQTRPHHIAANLALDTLKTVKSEQRWFVRAEVTPWPPGDHLDEICTSWRAASTLDHGSSISDLTADQVIDAGRRLGVLDEATQAALVNVYRDGLPGQDAARRLGTSVGSVRQRCSRGVRRLAEHARLLADAA